MLEITGPGGGHGQDHIQVIFAWEVYQPQPSLQAARCSWRDANKSPRSRVRIIKARVTILDFSLQINLFSCLTSRWVTISLSSLDEDV